MNTKSKTKFVVFLFIFVLFGVLNHVQAAEDDGGDPAGEICTTCPEGWEKIGGGWCAAGDACPVQVCADTYDAGVFQETSESGGDCTYPYGRFEWVQRMICSDWFCAEWGGGGCADYCDEYGWVTKYYWVEKCMMFMGVEECWLEQQSYQAWECIAYTTICAPRVCVLWDQDCNLEWVQEWVLTTEVVYMSYADYAETCVRQTVVDCEPECTWSEWSECDGSVRTRVDSCTGLLDSEQCVCTWSVWWTECTVACGGGTQVRADDCGNFEPRDCNTQSCNASISGSVWDATGECDDSPSNLLTDADLDGEVSVQVTSTDPSLDGIWDGSGGYSLSEVPVGPQTLCVNVPSPVGKPNHKYLLSCVNGAQDGIISGSCAVVNSLTPAINVDLGYSLLSSGWFQTIDGDIYAGCVESNCTASVDVAIPSAETILGGFKEFLITGAGTLLGNSDLSVSDGSYSEDDRYIKYMEAENMWPEAMVFDAPSSAEDVDGCSSMFNGNLDAGGVYSASSGCVQDGLDNLSGNYSVSGDGVAVVYVDGGTFTFENDFTSSSSDGRIVFVTSGAVEIGADIGTLAPTSADSAHVQASIIAAESITFLSNAPAEEDTTIIVEGPLVSKDGAIIFTRDRGLNNAYPATVIKYNPAYLTELSKSKPFGLSSVDISWIIEN